MYIYIYIYIFIYRYIYIYIYTYILDLTGCRYKRGVPTQLYPFRIPECT